MDAALFDTLIKRLATTALTRSTVLRGLAASGAALTGVRLTAAFSAATNSNKKKRRVCVCQTADAATCATRKKAKKAVKSILKTNACAYRGPCQGSSGCSPGPQCTNNADCPPFQACLSGVCGPCTHFTQCAAGQACLKGGLCVGNIPCAGDPDCEQISSILHCEQADGPDPKVCLSIAECPPAKNLPPCAGAEEFCVLGECVVTCSDADPCTQAGTSCIGGLCLSNT